MPTPRANVTQLQMKEDEWQRHALPTIIILVLYFDAVQEGGNVVTTYKRKIMYITGVNGLSYNSVFFFF